MVILCRSCGKPLRAMVAKLPDGAANKAPFYEGMLAGQFDWSTLIEFRIRLVRRYERTYVQGVEALAEESRLALSHVSPSAVASDDTPDDSSASFYSQLILADKHLQGRAANQDVWPFACVSAECPRRGKPKYVREIAV